MFLYEKINTLKKAGAMSVSTPEIILNGLSANIKLREYQHEAYQNFIYYYQNDKLSKNKQIHTLFHMATGSGKTVIMAGLMLYLFTQGYKKFLFFVNQSNILEKTIDNFTNHLSSKYLFNEIVQLPDGTRINIKKVTNFSNNTNDLEIIFSSTQKLHNDLSFSKEQSLTYEDFENNKIVFISDESHHVNTLTKKKNKEQIKESNSWEYTVLKAFRSNKDNILLEFTATCDLKDNNVLQKYEDKIIYNYPLISFRASGYTKDFYNFATDTDLWTRALIAIVMSEYRKYLFADLKLNIKPVVMFKSSKISESEAFYNEFLHKISNISTTELFKLKDIDTDVLLLNQAIEYFEQKDSSLELLINSIQTSFNQNTALIMNGASDNNKTKQILVNSLEDINNPVRCIFAVDMLNEGWDVLNLFDIVRLYDTRQGSGKAGKIGEYTIKEAQLIGRGARYCPFVDGDEDYKYKRKYDSDTLSKKRILETLYFYSKNDSRYISELKQALIATGLQPPKPKVIEYKLKTSFKNSDFYKNTFIFSNTREIKSRESVVSLEASMLTKTYVYKTHSNTGSIISFMGKESLSTIKNTSYNQKILKFKEINLNILLGALDCFDSLNFQNLKAKYPTLNSKEEFLCSDNFLGNNILEIHYIDTLATKDVFEATKFALSNISSYINSIKTEYKGSSKFNFIRLEDALKDKSIYLESIDQNGGRGCSQIQCNNLKYQLDLSKEDWYVFNDNFGTSEEKLFIKFFKQIIEPKLKAKNCEYYVIRNERVPQFAIYAFDGGERFEPDFLLFIKKTNTTNKDVIYQGYVEPKGQYLLLNDKWKEDFLKQIQDYSVPLGLFADNYKIFGLPFFNEEERKSDFEKAIADFINTI